MQRRLFWRLSKLLLQHTRQWHRHLLALQDWRGLGRQKHDQYDVFCNTTVPVCGRSAVCITVRQQP